MGPLGPVLRGYSAERKELQENLVGISLRTDQVRAPRTWTLVLEGRATMSIALDREGEGGSGSFQDPTQGGWRQDLNSSRADPGAQARQGQSQHQVCRWPVAGFSHGPFTLGTLPIGFTPGAPPRA